MARCSGCSGSDGDVDVTAVCKRTSTKNEYDCSRNCDVQLAVRDVERIVVSVEINTFRGLQAISLATVQVAHDGIE